MRNCDDNGESNKEKFEKKKRQHFQKRSSNASIPSEKKQHKRNKGKRTKGRKIQLSISFVALLNFGLWIDGVQKNLVFVAEKII